MIKSRIILSLIIFLLVIKGNSQNRQPEHLYTHFDKDFYVAGEDLWYSVYVLNPSSRVSGLLYTELCDVEGNKISRQILKITDNYVKGDIALPPDLPQGYYEFRAYTQWNLNFSPQVIYRKFIPIYKLNFDIEYVEPPEVEAYIPIASKGVEIKTDKQIYQTREPISLSLLGSKQGFCSLSVIDLRYGKKNQEIQAYVSALKTNPLSKFVVDRGLEPEKNYARSFKIYHPETNEAINSSFVMGFIRQTQQKMIRPAINGLVHFEFDDFYDSTIIQIFDANPFYQTIIPRTILQEEHPIIEAGVIPNKDLPITPEILYYIHNYQKRFQLHKLFGSQANMRAEKPQLKASRYIPTNAYKVDDFITLDNMEDFIKHTIPPLKVKYSGKKGNQTRSFTLYLPHAVHVRGVKQRVKKPPLLMVNNYFTYDAEAVMNIDWENIKQIDVYNSASNKEEDVSTNLPAQFGPIGEFGVVAFHTRDGITPSKIRETTNNLYIPGFYLARSYDSYINQNRTVEESKIPNLNPLLYWESGILIQDSQSSEIIFPANDQAGTYLIRVEGISVNGEPVYGEAVIEIE